MRRVWEQMREMLRDYLRDQQSRQFSMTLDSEQLQAVSAAFEAQGIPFQIASQSVRPDENGQMQVQTAIRLQPQYAERALQAANTQLGLMKMQARDDLGKCSIQLGNDEQTAALTQALERAGIPFDVQRTTLAQDKKGRIQARASVSFPEQEFERVRGIAQDVLKMDDHENPVAVEGPTAPTSPNGPDAPNGTNAPKHREFTEDIRAKVERARAGASSVEEFESRCRAEGLGVERTSDGELKFTHPEYGWFELRADTLGKEYSVKSFDKTPQQRAAEDPIKSHDGADIDTRTGVVESVVDTPGDGTATRERQGQGDRDGEKLEGPGIDLDAEAKDARDVSHGLAEERGVPDIQREAPNFPNIER